MKTDLATSIGAAIAGVVIAYFVCNLFLGPIEDFTYKTIDTDVTTDITEPNIEIFNYRALNPTVEVYVGECDEYDEYGNCIEQTTINDVEEDALEDILQEDTSVDQENG